MKAVLKFTFLLFVVSSIYSCSKNNQNDTIDAKTSLKEKDAILNGQLIGKWVFTKADLCFRAN